MNLIYTKFKKLILFTVFLCGIAFSLSAQYTVISSGVNIWVLQSNVCGGTTNVTCAEGLDSSPPVGHNYYYSGGYYYPSNSSYQTGSGSTIACHGCDTDYDLDGVCHDDDCNDWDASIGAGDFPGTACDDNNPSTINDMILSDGCSCAGTYDPCASQGGDSDGDGTCNNQDCQPFNPSYPATPGSSCNDGNPNTINDVVTANGCGCQGVVPDPCASQGGDSDGDGTCNNQDCQPFNPSYPATPGSSCNDGNPNTINDVVTANGCGCQGVVPDPCASQGGDSDGDGTCNNQDCQPFNPSYPATPGSSCNDGNPNTINDVVTANGCGCQGVVPDPCASQGGDSDGDGTCNNQDCQPFNPAYPATPGTACNDGNPNTINDVVTANGCGCQGVVPDPCASQGGDSDGDGTCNNQDCQPFNPAYPAIPGTSCNDGNPNTTNDVVTADGCGCEGTPVGPTCSVTINNCSITISGLTSSEYAKVFDTSWNIVWECHPWSNGGCNNTETITDLENGTYYVQACGNVETVSVIGCTTNPCATQGGDSDNDGTCDNQDCQPFNAAYPATPGTSCNDGNPNTTNDVVTADGCGCQGTPVGPTCSVTTSNCSITISGLTSSEYAKVFDTSWNIVWECHPWSNGGCNNTETITDLENGTYYVQACGNVETVSVIGCTTNPCATQGGDSDNDGTCDNQDCQPFNAAYPATPGTSCNDGNPNTTNDVVTADGCGCQGTPVGPTCSVTTSNCSITISGLTSSEYAKIFDTSWNIVWECHPWSNGGCNNTETITDLENGTYYVQACGSTETVAVSGCTTSPCAGQGGDSDNDGTCDNQDCQPFNAAYPATPGTSCNDGNPNTTNDVVTADGCDCQGTPVGPTCSVTTNNCSITISGLTSSEYAKIFDTSWNIVWECHPWSNGGCNNTETITDLDNGTYYVQACGNTETVSVSGCTTNPCAGQGGDSDNDGTCDNQDCQPFNAAYPATPGTSCNDGNPNTTNDVVTADGCDCQGTPVGPTCSVTTNNCSITISGLISSEYAKIFDTSWNIVWECHPWSNGGCNNTETITGLDNGTYYVQACGNTETVSVSGCITDPCDGQGGDSDNDGTCDNQDCQPFNPAFPATPGTPCNDGDSNTENDVVTANGCDCGGTIIAPCAGQGGDSDNDGTCNFQDCQPFNPAFPATPGTPCNDGNPNTENDVVTANGCGCAGTEVAPTCTVSGTTMCPEYVNAFPSGTYSCVDNAPNDIVMMFYAAGTGGAYTNTLRDYNLTFTENFSNGSANINGQVVDCETNSFWTVNITLTNKTYSSDDPKTSFCYCDSNTSDWYYYNNLNGTVSSGSTSLSINNSGLPKFQIGTGANIVDEHCNDYSASSWFNITNHNVWDRGDIFFNLACSSNQLGEANEESLFFNASKDGRDVALSWTTNTDYKNDYFEVEHSTDGINFTLMSEVMSISDSENHMNYQDRDVAAKIGMNYYRIKQVFNDGNYIYSAVKEVAFDLDVNKFEIYPNPTADDVFVNLKDFAGNAGTIQIVNSLGQIVYTQQLDIISAEPLRISTQDMKSGVHAVSVQIEDKKIMTELLMVVKR